MLGRVFSLLGWLAAASIVTGCASRPPDLTIQRGVPVTGKRPGGPPAPVAAEIFSDCGISRLRDSVLKQLNAARAKARFCGAVRKTAARPLAWDAKLAEAAELHSVDMAARRYFDHVNPEGKRVSQRVTAQGYKWRMVGENLAGGDTTVAAVISGWLGSPEHCQNMMSPAYADVGVSCMRQPGSQWGNYWTMVLATRR